MNPKIQLDADADGVATSRFSSSVTGPSTRISGDMSGSTEGTSTLSIAVGTGVVRFTGPGRWVGEAVRGGVVAGAGVTLAVGLGRGV